MDPYYEMTGMVRLKLTAADITGLLRELTEAGVAIYQISPGDHFSVILAVQRKDVPVMEKLCEKRGAEIAFLRQRGLHRIGNQILRRPVFLAWLLLITVLSVFLSGRILFFQVQGNDTIPARMILETAEQAGFGFGSSRREVRSEKLKNILLEEIPQLQWAGVNTRGCLAVISVRERVIPEKAAEYTVGDVVACRDGYILSATATRGDLRCQPGQAVTEGQILISGYTDCGLSIRAEQAQGEIYAKTIRTIRAVHPNNSRKKTSNGGLKKKISLLVGKKRINLWKDSGISDGFYDRMYEEYYVTLPGGFRLPIALVVQTYGCAAVEESGEGPEADGRILTRESENYILGQMNAGQILTRRVNLLEEAHCLRLTGEYDCIEMIGKIRRLEIGEHYGEDH